MLSISEVCEWALSLPGVEEVGHWGKRSFRMNSKIFAIVQDDQKTLTVKTTREERDLYTRTAPEIYSVPESYSNLSYMHINLVTAGDEDVKGFIRSAWGLVAPKKVARAYFEQG